VLKPILENLLSRDAKTGELIPLLAERWEVLAGVRAWKFHLRKGVPFHGGQGEVTAEDVKYTLRITYKNSLNNQDSCSAHASLWLSGAAHRGR
jgi:ABC-type transport system substrate-binding protein